MNLLCTKVMVHFNWKVALQVGTAFGGRSHDNYYVGLGNVSSCTFDAFLHLMFPLITTCKEGILEWESKACRSHWAQIHGVTGPVYDPTFWTSGRHPAFSTFQKDQRNVPATGAAATVAAGWHLRLMYLTWLDGDFPTPGRKIRPLDTRPHQNWET